MTPTLKAEFKKLITVRSTYILVIAALLLAGLFTYLGTGPSVYEEVKEAPASNTQTAEGQPPPPPEVTVTVSKDLSKEKLIINMQDAIQLISLLIAISVVLLMTHEYRYNTITYTLTSSNKRSKVLLSKIIVSGVFISATVLLALGVVTAMTYAAVSIKDLYLPAQDFNWGYIMLRLVGYALGFCLLMLAIAALVRSTVAGIVAIFLLTTIDAIGGEILKNWDLESSRLLPLSALNRVANLSADYIPQNVPDDGFADMALMPATVLGATAVFAVYFIATWAVSWYLFLRRDAA